MLYRIYARDDAWRGEGLSATSRFHRGIPLASKTGGERKSFLCLESSMPRAIWKGSIGFGLVYIPVRLFPAVRNDDIDFDWLDKRSMAPVGYRRVNKQTGKEIDRKFIVRGYEYKPDHYVALSDEEIRAANPKATQSVDILCFAELAEVPFLHLETPYYLVPDKKGEKVYALLREALKKTGKIGIAHVVMHTKQHLAAVIPSGNALVLNTLRWAEEMRGLQDLDLPAAGAKAAGISAKELSMAGKLIDDMSDPLDLTKYRDTFRDDILALVERKVKAGKTEVVEAPEKTQQPAPPNNVIDLTELLKRSLDGGKKGKPSPKKRRRAHAAKPRAVSAEKRAS
jgi:DNA end-binding protein Ku